MHHMIFSYVFMYILTSAITESDALFFPRSLVHIWLGISICSADATYNYILFLHVIQSYIMYNIIGEMRQSRGEWRHDACFP